MAQLRIWTPRPRQLGLFDANKADYTAARDTLALVRKVPPVPEDGPRQYFVPGPFGHVPADYMTIDTWAPVHPITRWRHPDLQFWYEIAALCRKQDLYLCKLCGEDGYGQGGIDVHHRTYKRWGHELLEDLTTLCHPCHMHHHGEERLLKIARRTHRRAAA